MNFLKRPLFSYKSCILYLLLLIFNSCKSKLSSAYYKCDSSYETTILVEHQECTGCNDVVLKKGTIKIPDYLIDSLHTAIYTDASTVDIKLTGNFSDRIINPNNFFHNSNSMYEITGKVVSTYYDSSTGELVPVFYVKNWNEI